MAEPAKGVTLAAIIDGVSYRKKIVSDRSCSKSIVYFWPDKLLYISDDPGRGMRFHENTPARILSVGLRGDIRLKSGAQFATLTRTDSVFHALNSSWGDHFTGDLVCNLLIDPASVWQPAIEAKMQGQLNGFSCGFSGGSPNESISELDMVSLLSAIYENETPQAMVSSQLDHCFGMDANASWIRPDLDRRIHRIVATLQGNLSNKQSIKALAGMAGLSESRLHYLFKDEIGVSVSRYILWRRFYSVCRILLAEGNMLRAALAVGFWDAAHMSRTLKSLIGVPPSYLLRTALRSKRQLVSSME